MESLNLPKAFIHSLDQHFEPHVVEQVIEGLKHPASTAIRTHQGKFKGHVSGQPIPWAKNALRLSERPNFAHDPHWHGGAYYVQDASSMVIGHVAEQLLRQKENILALDACAAPGGKTLSLLDAIDHRGFVVANEVDPKRNTILRENLQKWGNPRQAVTQLSMDKLGDLGSVFDLVLLDAPCSGEGMFRKDSFAIQQWSQDLVMKCSQLQGELLNAATALLKPEGFLIYATCTMNPEENEKNVAQLLEQGMELVTIDASKFDAHAVPAIHQNQHLGYYLLPGISLGEGLFFAVLKKTEGAANRPLKKHIGSHLSTDASVPFEIPTLDHYWQPGDIGFGVEGLSPFVHHFPASFPFKAMGLEIWQSKGKLRVPGHGIAMHPEAATGVALNREQALQYLRRVALSWDSTSISGWNLVSFEQTNLGWVKLAPGRMNNHYPSNLRIRK